MKFIFLLLSVISLSVGACKKNKTDNNKDSADKYVSLLVANKYPKYDIIPKLDKEDIDLLLKHANNSNVIENYPIPAFSAAAYGPQKVGMIILYTVESIRLQRPVGASSRPYVTDTAAQRKADLAEVAQHYISWWNKNKDKTAEELKNISPFEGTALTW